MSNRETILNEIALLRMNTGRGNMERANHNIANALEAILAMVEGAAPSPLVTAEEAMRTVLAVKPLSLKPMLAMSEEEIRRNEESWKQAIAASSSDISEYVAPPSVALPSVADAAYQPTEIMDDYFVSLPVEPAPEAEPLIKVRRRVRGEPKSDAQDAKPRRRRRTP